MELYPKTNYLRIEHLQLSGIFETYVPVKYVVPVTPHDYMAYSSLGGYIPPPHLDLDMVYGHYGTKEMYVFSKWGEWKKEGINHENLSLEKTYNETNWFDEFLPHNY